MKNHAKRHVIHRSFTIDDALVKQAQHVVPAAVAGNLNRMVTVALTELVAKYERLLFGQQIAAMAADPAVSRESKKATADFKITDPDGL